MSSCSGRIRSKPTDEYQTIFAAALLAPANLPESVGTCVLVAWNGCREATRAISDALPLLKRATLVTLLQSVEPWEDIQR